jgi:acyl transferase domain-containing protein
MVGLDLACSSLRNSDITIVSFQWSLNSGGSDSNQGLVAVLNLMLSPVCSTMLSQMDFLPSDGLCYSFYHRADGYVRGEGILVMVLEQLSHAIGAGDTIRAVIRAGGTNQDGPTLGLTQPISRAQEALISGAYTKAGLGVVLTWYVDTHSTGTTIKI